MKALFVALIAICPTFIIPCRATPVVVGAQALQSYGDRSAATTLSLPGGCQLYVYGAATGGASPMNTFISGQTVQLKNANGNVAAQLAVTTDNNNSYTTGTSYNVFGGFGVSGFNYVQGFYGVNPGPGPNFHASVHFSLNAPAMVAVMGMGSSQTVLALSGLYDPIIDVPVRTAQPATQALIIAHQYLLPGTYTIEETTGDGFPGQTPENEVDLIGVFVLSDQPNVASSSSPQIPMSLSSKPLSGNASETLTTTGQSTQGHADIIYVSEIGNNTIKELDSATGADLGIFASTGLANPLGLAFDSTGNLYAANWNSGTIEKFTPYGGASVFTTGLGGPTGLAFDGADNLYVATYYDNTIYKFTPGGVRSIFASTGLSWPYGLAFDGAGNLYVANKGNNTIEKFTPDGVGSVFASTGNQPVGLAIDRAGNIYTGGIETNIEKFTPAGDSSVFANDPNGIIGLAFDSAGNLYAAGGSDIKKITPSGTILTFATGLSGPNFIAIKGPPRIVVPPPVSSNRIPTLPDGTGGQIRILSGTGDFASVSDSNKTLNVTPGATLNGTINLSILNLGHSDAVAPLIYTPSWGDHSSSWRQVKNSVPAGQSEQQANVSFAAPTTPGVYHIIFAACWEIGGDHVASATIWDYGKDVWNDGNDIADFNTTQLSSAQLNGWAVNAELYKSDLSHPAPWYRERYYPADAITLIVTEAGVSHTNTLPPSGIIEQPKPPVDEHHFPLAHYLVLSVVGLAIIGMAIVIIRLIMPRHGNHGRNNFTEN